MEQRTSGTRLAASVVLVADDDADVRSAVSSMLEADGYSVMQAADGDTALEILARGEDHPESRPDVVLLDFVMPAFLDPGVEQLARALGAVRVVRKPFDEDELREAVLEAARAPASLARNAGLRR